MASASDRATALVEDLCAGWAVGRGAVLAGDLQKRSEWKHEYNRRFFVLTTDELVWVKRERAEEVRCHSWRFAAPTGERRHFTLRSGLSVVVGGEGTLTISGPGTKPFKLRANSEAEILAWKAAIYGVTSALLLDAQVASRYVKERSSLFAPGAFSELPHCGSRNHRERSITKTFYAAAARATKKGLGKLLGGGSGDAPLLLSLTTLPPAVAAWGEDQLALFVAVLDALGASGHPALLPPSHVEVVSSASRLATVRPLLPLGSVKDLVNRVHDPRQRYTDKYGLPADGRAAGASEDLHAASAGRGAVEGGGGGGGGSSSRAREGMAGIGAEQPLSTHRIALLGRQILEGLRFLRACGVPTAHVHAGNVLVRRVPTASGAPADGGWLVQFSEYENALLGLPHFAEQHGLAVPRLHAASTVAFTVSRDVLAFGHILHLLATGLELTDERLSKAVGARVPGPGFPGPPAAWALLERIFLPRKDMAKAPSLVELLAEPFFSVALPAAAQPPPAVAPPVLTAAAEKLLKTCRRRYGGDTLTISPAGVGAGGVGGGNTGGGVGTSSGAVGGIVQLGAAGKPAPTVVVVDHPTASGGGEAAAEATRPKRTFNYSFGAGSLGLLLRDDESSGRVYVGEANPDGQAMALGVPVGGLIVAVGGQSVKDRRLRSEEVAALIQQAPRPVVIRIQTPKSKSERKRGSGGGPGTTPATVAAGAVAGASPSLMDLSPPDRAVEVATEAAAEAAASATVEVAAEAEAEAPVSEPLRKYAMMLKAGVPRVGVEQKMSADGLTVDEISAMFAAQDLRRRRSTSADSSASLDARLQEQQQQEEEWDD